MEQNKIRTYILYAVGEIFLVVIGILIALQINNLNEQRKNRAYELTMLKEVREALVSDIEIISSRIPYLKSIERNARELAIIKNDKSAPTDSVIFYVESIISYGTILLVNSSPYEAIESGGLNRISNAKLRSQLANVYGNSIPIAQTWINEVLRENLYLKAEMANDLFNRRVVPGKVSGISTELRDLDIDLIYNDSRFDEFLNTSMSALPVAFRYMERTVSDMKALLDVIDLELEGRLE